MLRTPLQKGAGSPRHSAAGRRPSLCRVGCSDPALQSHSQGLSSPRLGCPSGSWADLHHSPALMGFSPEGSLENHDGMSCLETCFKHPSSWHALAATLKPGQVPTYS